MRPDQCDHPQAQRMHQGRRARATAADLFAHAEESADHSIILPWERWGQTKRGKIMTRTDNLMELPKDLPVPQDDGACAHLTGMKLPAITLRSTRGRAVDLAKLKGTTVVYIYPRTGRPDQELPTGWNAIPGARGCTPQSCAFRDHYQELAAVGATVYGLSTQDTEYQSEAAQRLHLPFPLLSDARLEFARALRLPTF